jgi:hypothetical protein
MVKLLKILGHTTLFLWEIVLALIILLSFAIRSTRAQTYFARQATAYLSKELDATIKIDKLSIIFIDKVALDGVLIIDKKNDTLGYIKTLYATVEHYDLGKRFFKLSKVELDQGNVNIYRAKSTGDWNFKFLADYFASSDTTTTKSKPMGIAVRNVVLNDLNFSFHDNRKKELAYGMDFNHLAIRHLNLDAKNILSSKGSIQLKIEQLSLQERCGFTINKMSGKALISPKGYRVRNLDIQTPNSSLILPQFALLVDKPSDFGDFVNKVKFRVRLEKTVVSLKDVSYFVPNIEGMDEKITITADLDYPISNLAITNLDLRIGKESKIIGDFKLPNFTQLSSSNFDEKFKKIHIFVSDLENIKLPLSSKTKYLELGTMAERVAYFDARNFRFKGKTSDFVVSSDTLNTNIGHIAISQGIHIYKDKNERFQFEKNHPQGKLLVVHDFNLGRLINNKDIGIVSGDFDAKGYFTQKGEFELHEVNGIVQHLDYAGYSYKNIGLEDISFTNNVLNGKINVDDPNVKLAYDGSIDLNTKQRFDFDLDLTKAHLDKLGIKSEKAMYLNSKMHVNLSGTNPNNYSGIISLDNLTYKEGDLDLVIPEMTIGMTRGLAKDLLTIESDILDGKIDGIIDVNTVAASFTNQFSKVLPAIISPPTSIIKNDRNNFNYDLIFKDFDEVLKIFVPDLTLAKNTQIKGNYNGFTNNFKTAIDSEEIKYLDKRFIGVNIDQEMVNGELLAEFDFAQFYLNDSLEVKNLNLETGGSSNQLNSIIQWNSNTPEESKFKWNTKIIGKDNFNFVVDPSYVVLKGKKWVLPDTSTINYQPKHIIVDQFKLKYNDQFIAIDGVASDDADDRIRLRINDVQLGDFNDVIGGGIEISGVLNGQVLVRTPFSEIELSGGIDVEKLFLNKSEVGDISLNADWDKANKAILLGGDLNYKKQKTFAFDGNYYLEREENSLDFNISLDHTDLTIANAFMDPLVISGIRGAIDGKLKIEGTPQKPIVTGNLKLENANAKIGILGVNFGLDGIVKIDEYGIYLKDIPLIDEDGNGGIVKGAIFHDNFTNWSFDIVANLEEDANNPVKGRKGQYHPLDQFLVMNTKYKEGDIYYGKAYITGIATISGTADNTAIVVNVKTQKNTAINFPMYGQSEISESSFITWKDAPVKVIPDKINVSGITMDLTFNVTEDAKMKLIMSDKTGEEISADGSGKLELGLDALGNATLKGTYTLNSGKYNFTMGPAIQNFYIVKGGTIAWTGDPLGATLNVQAKQTIAANINLLSEDPSTSAKGNNQNVDCVIDVKGGLTNFKLGFDVQAPNASSQEKEILAAAKTTEAEKQRLAVSLMVMKQFIPKAPGASGSSGTAADILEQQLDLMASKLGGDFVKVGVDLESSSSKLDLEKKFLDDRVIIKGSFGVEKNSAGGSSRIGNINLEYLINEDGTFRLSAFNQSDAKNPGKMIQGTGITYQEEFDKLQDLKMLQFFLDIFRKKENKRIVKTKKRRQKPVPPLPSATTQVASVTDRKKENQFS